MFNPYTHFFKFLHSACIETLKKPWKTALRFQKRSSRPIPDPDPNRRTCSAKKSLQCDWWTSTSSLYTSFLCPGHSSSPSSFSAGFHSEDKHSRVKSLTLFCTWNHFAGRFSVYLSSQCFPAWIITSCISHLSVRASWTLEKHLFLSGMVNISCFFFFLL